MLQCGPQLLALVASFKAERLQLSSGVIPVYQRSVYAILLCEDGLWGTDDRAPADLCKCKGYICVTQLLPVAARLHVVCEYVVSEASPLGS